MGSGVPGTLRHDFAQPHVRGRMIRPWVPQHLHIECGQVQWDVGKLAEALRVERGAMDRMI